MTDDHTKRKGQPLARGLLDYFPAALAAVAECSRICNDQHNPGEPMHWARGKSTDHADCVIRHLVDRGTVDTDDIRHTTKVAWRALALLQEELEAAGAAPGRASVFVAAEPATKWGVFWRHASRPSWLLRSDVIPEDFDSEREALEACAERNAKASEYLIRPLSVNGC